MLIPLSGFDMGLAVVEANNDIAPWLEGPWCTSDSSNFWTDRDPMRDAANQFCAGEFDSVSVAAVSDPTASTSSRLPWLPDSD